MQENAFYRNCLPAFKIYNPPLIKELELKDVVYQFKKRACGLTGQKLETSYFDGSSSELAVVSIPSIESLVMHLDVNNFKEINVVVTPEEYRQFVLKKSNRGVNAVCLCALKHDESCSSLKKEDDWIKDYERSQLNTMLDRQDVEPLYEYYCKKRDKPFSMRGLFLLSYLRAPNGLNGIFLFIFKCLFGKGSICEIVKNFKYNPKDKLCIEYGKILYRENEREFAVTVLKSVTQRLNADWRSVYRAFYLLSCLYKDLGLMEESQNYRKLCLTCNPRFPLELFEKISGETMNVQV